jgi:hypothetical protein
MALESVTVTRVPDGPLLGETSTISGGGGPPITSKIGDVAVPPAVVIVMGPLGTYGTLTLNWSSITVQSLSFRRSTPQNWTDLTKLRFSHLTKIQVPGLPLDGVMEVMVGGGGGTTVKRSAVVKVPLSAETLIGPVVAPSGT